MVKRRLHSFFQISSILGTLALLFFFQNCGKGASVGSSEGGIATTASVPASDPPPDPPPAEGDGGGGIGGGKVPPVCFQMTLTTLSPSTNEEFIFQIQPVGLKGDSLIKIIADKGYFYYKTVDGQDVKVADIGVAGTGLYFQLNQQKWLDSDISAAFYHKDYCPTEDHYTCYQPVPICSVLFPR